MNPDYSIAQNIYGFDSVEAWRLRKSEKLRGTLRYELRQLGLLIRRYAVIGSLILFFLLSCSLCWLAAGMMIAAHPWELQGYHPSK